MAEHINEHFVPVYYDRAEYILDAFDDDYYIGPAYFGSVIHDERPTHYLVAINHFDTLHVFTDDQLTARDNNKLAAYRDIHERPADDNYDPQADNYNGRVANYDGVPRSAVRAGCHPSYDD